MRDAIPLPREFGPDPRTARRLALIEAGIERAAVIDGLRLNYQVHGRGPVVVLIHGVAGSATDWGGMAGPLVEEGYCVLCVETRGAGYSDRPPSADYSIWALAAELAKLLRQLRIRRAAVAGNSLGGAIAIALARKAPRLVSKLALFDTVAHRRSMPLVVSGLRLPLVPRLLARFLPPRPLVGLVLSVLGCDASWVTREVVSEYTHELSLPGRIPAMLETLRSFMRSDPRELDREVGRIAQPTLVVWGEEDPVFPVEDGERLHREIASSRLVVLPGCGHMPNLEAPRRLLPHLLRFLRNGRRR